MTGAAGLRATETFKQGAHLFVVCMCALTTRMSSYTGTLVHVVFCVSSSNTCWLFSGLIDGCVPVCLQRWVYQTEFLPTLNVPLLATTEVTPYASHATAKVPPAMRAHARV